MGHRYSGTVVGGVGTTVLPSSSLYAGANKDLRLFEVHAFNTNINPVEVNLVRLDTAGTKPAAVTDAPYDPNGPAAEAGVHAVHTVGPTIDELIERLMFGEAIGAGVILTFGAAGLLIPAGVTNGVGLVLRAGTDQLIQTTYVWEE